jgi:glycosyltransferase involved in cell wall biosynthesis
MPVYNRAERVGAAIESLLAQTFTDFELIIVDDGSRDTSLEVTQGYADQDARVRVLALPVNGGQGLARAIGTDAACGRYLAVMDSDDFALPNRLETQVHWMDAHPNVTLAGANAQKVMPTQRIQMQMPAADGAIKALLLLVDGAFVHPTVIMRLDFLRQHNLQNYGTPTYLARKLRDTHLLDQN